MCACTDILVNYLKFTPMHPHLSSIIMLIHCYGVRAIHAGLSLIPPPPPHPHTHHYYQLYRELSFKKGDIVDLLHTVDANWLQGSLGGVKGIFPATYIQVHLAGVDVYLLQSQSVVSIVDCMQSSVLVLLWHNIRLLVNSYVVKFIFFIPYSG